MALLNNADAIYLGGRPVDRVYLGARQVWPWTPELLFQNGEQGALYYFTPDFAGLYQDDRGTTPVTATTQPVGLMLDRRFGLERGPEMMPADPDWDLSSNPTAIVSGQRIETTGRGNVSASVGTFNGTTWLIEFDIVRKGPFSAQVFAGGIVGGTTVPQIHPLGRFRAILVNTSGSRYDEFIFGGNNEGWIIDNISVREIPGNHASQATTTARPTLRSGPLRIDYDGVDDYLRTAFPALGSNVTIARSIPGVGAQILTGQTIAAGNWDDNVTSCATLVIDRALTGPETALVTAFLNQQAGV